jgi:hypothetical protein
MALFNIPIHVTSGNYVFTRELFDQLKGFRNFRWCHDYDFAMRASIFTEPVLVSKKLLAYRMHEGNTISSKDIHYELFSHEIRRILEEYLEQISAKYHANEKINPLAPSPYNWPLFFQDHYRRMGPFFKSHSFLTQVSLCNRIMVPTKSSEVSVDRVLTPFLKDPSDAAEALRSLPGLHFLHRKNFVHVSDKSIQSLKITNIRTTKYKENPIGSLISAQAKMDFPYLENLSLLGVFHNQRLIGVLRYIRTIKNSLEFQGHTTETLSFKDQKSLSLCWLDFDKSTLICRWKKRPQFLRSRKTPKRIQIRGHVDVAQIQRDFLVVHGWGTVNFDLPEKIELFINGKKANHLPHLCRRDDVRHLLKNPDSCSAVGFQFHIPTHQFRGDVIDVTVAVGAGKETLRLQRQIRNNDIYQKGNVGLS